MLQDQDTTNSSGPQTAREAAKLFVRPYVLDGWELQELAKKQPRTDRPAEFAAQIGGGKVTDHQSEQRTLTRNQLAVTRIGDMSCFVVFDLADILAEVRDEQRGYSQMSLMEIFALQEQERIAQAEREEAEEERQRATQSSKRPPAVYRAYMAGRCQNPACGADLGYIEVAGGRDREYCNTKCRVAAKRIRDRETKWEEIIQYHAELRQYWQEHNVKGRVLSMMHDILIYHGKQAARAATDAVLYAQVEHEHRVIHQRAALMIDLFELGDEINYAALIDVDVEASLESWSWFADRASVNQLRAAIDNALRIKTAPERAKRLHSPPTKQPQRSRPQE
jgi:hypothetical protein